MSQNSVERVLVVEHKLSKREGLGVRRGMLGVARKKSVCFQSQTYAQGGDHTLLYSSKGNRVKKIHSRGRAVGKGKKKKGSAERGWASIRGREASWLLIKKKISHKGGMLPKNLHSTKGTASRISSRRLGSGMDPTPS